MLKRAISALLAMTLVLSLLPVQAFATEAAEEPAEAAQPETIHEVYINPLYADTLTEADLVQPSGVMPAGVDSAYLDSLEAVAALVRDQMEQRSETIVVNYKSASVESNLLKAIANEAMKHTGVPTEGDYLRWQYGGAHMSRSYYEQGGVYYSTLTITVTYYTTAGQEQVMDTEVPALLDALELEGLSDYQTVKAIYDWICANVTYDYDNLTDNTYMLKHSAYAALVNKTAVCQGYAVLLYRLLLEEDIDCRLISGTGNGGPHGWNIVVLDGVYYNLDATWDAGAGEYDYFLRSPNFPGHIRDAEYETTAFHSRYPMADADYTINCTHEATRLENAAEATCTEDGYTGDLVCADCGTVVTQGQNTPALGHDFQNGKCIRCVELDPDSQEHTHSFDKTTHACQCGVYGGECGDNLTWILSEDGVLVISGYGNMRSYNNDAERLPPWQTLVKTAIIEEGVTSIGDYAFYECPNLESITIPKSVTIIWYSAFFGCAKLEHVAIPYGVVKILSDAFRGCTNLTSITLPNSLTTIGHGAFNECTSLTNFTIPNSVTTIEEWAFSRCSALNSITIPDNVTSIGRHTFYLCTNLETVTIGNSVTSIGEYAFSGCTGLTDIIIPNSVTRLDNRVFERCTALTQITLPDSLTTIGERAFCDCTSLVSIVIPDGVTSIKTRTFWGCSNLATVVLSDSLTKIEDWAFNRCKKLEDIIIPDGVTHIGESAFCECNSLKHVTLPASLISIDDFAFSVCENLSDVIIPEHVTSIGIGAFFFCTSLKSIVLPKNLSSIERQTFTHCQNLTNITIPNSVTEIGVDAFYLCRNLTEIYFVGSAPVFSKNQYGNLENFYDVTATAYYPENDPTWTEEVRQNYGGTITWVPYGEHIHSFDETTHLCECGVYGGMCGENVHWELSDGVFTVSGEGEMLDYLWTGMTPWSYFDSIKTLIVNDGVSSIGDFAFSMCSHLLDVKLPSSIKRIGYGAFHDCYQITSIVIPEGVTAIGSNAFRWCSGLESVSVPDSVTEIGAGAFWGCSNLDIIHISKNVTNIGNAVFYACGLSGIWVDEENPNYCSDEFGVLFNKDKTKLLAYPGGRDGTYVIPNTVTEIDSCVFHKLTCQISVTLSDGITSIKDSEFYSCYGLKNIVISDSVMSIGNNAFYDCTSLTSIMFEADAPSFGDDCFSGVTATAYYPANKPTWTEEVMQNYGGTITWVPYAENTERISGKDRHETAFKIANMMKEVLGVQKFDTILIASGDDSADALAGSYLAAVKGAPILLSRNNSHPRNLAYIQENLSDNGIVYILGGTGAVPQAMEDLLIENGINYERVKGSDRFGTNLEILKKAGQIQGDEILVSTAYEFADSLSASATGKPILLVNSKRNVLTNAQKAYLAQITADGPKTFTIIGGTGAVSDELAEALSAYGTVNRVKGSGREATSVKVAETYFQDPDTVFLAYSKNFPDGLCGGPLAYTMKSPLLLVRTKYEAPAAAYVEENSITQGYILGGSAAVSDASVNLIFPG